MRMDSFHPYETSTQVRPDLGGIVFLHINSFCPTVPVRQDCSFIEIPGCAPGFMALKHVYIPQEPHVSSI